MPACFIRHTLWLKRPMDPYTNTSEWREQAKEARSGWCREFGGVWTKVSPVKGQERITATGYPWWWSCARDPDEDSEAPSSPTSPESPQKFSPSKK